LDMEEDEEVGNGSQLVGEEVKTQLRLV
jgi:hypothetical protein